MGNLTLILGGARSGKSTFALNLAEKIRGCVAFIATAQAGDPEMAARIAAHQRQRPADWRTLEIPHAIAATWLGQEIDADLIILDCLTLLVSNLAVMASPDVNHPNEGKFTELVCSEINTLIDLIQNSPGDWIVISNEVGLGLVPPYPLGRIYRDWLGWANQRLAAVASEVYLLVAGIPVPIHNYRL